MTIIFLGGGYATRLYPMTDGLPKGLLELNGHSLIDRILDGLGPASADRFILVTSLRFAWHWNIWAQHKPVTVVCDLTTDDTNKLGAIADLAFALRQCSVDDNVIVISPDNLFTAPLAPFAEMCDMARLYTPIIGTYDVGTKEKARQFGVVTLADHDPEPGPAERLVERVDEKPAEPSGTLVGVGLYYFPRMTVPLIHAYLEQGGNPDQPGRLFAWLCETNVVPVRAWPVPGQWLDIGSKEALDEANRQIT